PSLDRSVSDGGDVWLESAAARARTNATVTAGRCGIARKLNGGSRSSEVLHCTPAAPKRVARSRALLDDPPSRRQANDQEHQEQNEEQPRQELGDGERRAGDRREPEQGRNHPDHEEHERHVQHEQNPPRSAFAKPMPCNTVESWTNFFEPPLKRPSR